ncbi:TonB-dependent receptor [Gallaecimonas mangrovi]|uniref:TonB-dependent receptor n=1 Tax=Gallaecimonas mangrovi TaxID=2291597 RepID=UPI0018688D72|nr:TonB-dependent receptor [Gallaecimonas mangrovi]
MKTQQHAIRSATKPLGYSALFLALFSGAVHAEQEADNSKEAASSKPTDVIVVTSQKRTQNVMDVPVPVDVVSGSQLKETGSVSLGDMSDYTPGFSFSKNEVVQGTATMRGISSSNISTGGDPSVAVFFDDFYMPRAAQSVLFSDLQRVEVLKGPQGTLFGKNAAAGVVSIYPNEPSDDVDGYLDVRLGDYSLRRIEGMVNLPLTDTLYLRVNGITNQRDSYVDNENSDYNGDELGNRDHQAARVAMLWKATDSTSLQLAYDWDHLHQGYSAQLGVSDYAYSTDPASRKMASDVDDGHEWRDMSAISMKLNHTFSDKWSGKFISSYREWEASGKDDTDGTADITRYVDTINYEDSDIFYNEVQFNYQGDRLSYVGGATYSKENVYQKTTVELTVDTVERLVTESLNDTLVSTMQSLGYDDATIASLGLPVDHIWNASDWGTVLSVMSQADPSVNSLLSAMGSSAFDPGLADAITATGDLSYQAMSEALGESALLGPSYSGQYWGENVANRGDFTSYGVYSDFDYKINDKWGAIFGLRYSYDKKKFSWKITENTVDGISLPSMVDQLFPLVDNLEASHNWSKWTGRVGGRYHINENQMAYLTYSTGYKAGGYDSLDVTTAENPFKPESVKDIELGYKASLFDVLRVQLDVYNMDVDNRQQSVNSMLPGSSALVPVIINGDQKIKGLEMLLDWQATDNVKLGMVGEYRHTKSDWNDYYNSEGQLVTDESHSSDVFDYTLTFDYFPSLRLAAGTFKFHMDYVFAENTAKDDPDLLPIAYQIPDYFNDTKDLNAQLSWFSSDDHWQVSIWGKNLLDNTTLYNLGGFAAEILDTPTVRVNDPRTYGLDVHYRF